MFMKFLVIASMSKFMFLRHFTSFEFCIAYFANKTILTAKIFLVCHNKIA